MPEIAEKGKGALTRKVGPLPLWGWGVAGAAALFVAMKLRGGSRGASAGPGLVTIPSIGSGASAGNPSGGSPPIVSPSQNVHGGMDTAPGGTAPWWATPPPLLVATPGVPLSPQPSFNGSAGTADKGGMPNPFRVLPLSGAMSAPVENSPGGTVVVSPGTGTFATPGGSVRPGQQIIQTIPGAGGNPIAIYGP